MFLAHLIPKGKSKPSDKRRAPQKRIFGKLFLGNNLF